MIQVIVLAAAMLHNPGPMTTRRYLQGPESSRLITYFREGKILLGEVEHRDDWSVSYWDLEANGVWLVRGDLTGFDIAKAELSCPDGGAPIHSQTWCEGGLKVTLSAVAPFGRFPSAAFRVEVVNRGVSRVRKELALLARTGKEVKLATAIAPDFYSIYRPAVSNWLAMTVSEAAPDFVKAPSDACWENGAFRFAADLEPGARKTFDFTLGKGDFAALDYEATVAAAKADWSKLLARIGGLSPLVRDLAVTLLQCFARPVEGDGVLPRQGGQQRYVWPGEAIHVFAALDRLGYPEYTERANDFLFTHCVRETGEAGPFRNKWAADTAYVLNGFSRHCYEQNAAAFWARHRATAAKMLRWIASKREADGLFPPMKSTDSSASPMKHWGMTDLANLAALDWYRKAAGKFGDPIAAEADSLWADYRAAIVRVLDGWRERSKGSEELFLPITADGSREDELVARGFFYIHPGAFAMSGLLDEDELLRLRRWLLRRGHASEDGLYMHHPSRKVPEFGEHVWYTVWSEYEWFNAWRRVGRFELADQALKAALHTAVTREHATGERWHDANPWYFPWSPNASGAGRLVLMLLEAETVQEYLERQFE